MRERVRTGNATWVWISGLSGAVVLVALLGAVLFYSAMVFYVIGLTWLWDHVIELEALLGIAIASCVGLILWLTTRSATDGDAPVGTDPRPASDICR